MIHVYQILVYQQQSIEIFRNNWKDFFCFVHRWPDDYKVGLTKKILLDINVTNTGENAYDTKCFVQLPAGVEYVSANSSSIVRKNYTKMSHFICLNVY